MRKFSLLVLLFSVTLSNAQDARSIQKEIDKTLWKPFKEAFENSDGPALNGLYAHQVLRVTPNGIDTESKFKKSNLSHFEENKNSRTEVQLDFWFDSRHTNSNTSYEVGFYRIRLKNAENESTIYGQFHIVLKKGGGVWKITQDWDTTTINGHAITATDFEKRKPIEFE